MFCSDKTCTYNRANKCQIDLFRHQVSGEKLNNERCAQTGCQYNVDGGCAHSGFRNPSHPNRCNGFIPMCKNIIRMYNVR